MYIEGQIGKPTLEDAILLASIMHMGQVDKSGEPYILHPLTVMINVEAGIGWLNKRDLQIVAVLHDVVEDCNVTLDNLTCYNDDIVEAIDAITHRPNEPNKEYWTRVAKNDMAYMVKLQDIAHNTSERRCEKLDEKTRQRLMCKYAKALTFMGRIRLIDNGYMDGGIN
jgi:(p)ppGpp synthase/HD superfamily hydrolase